jgi:uncharacterized cupredoxin-like copper-binding protein
MMRLLPLLLPLALLLAACGGGGSGSNAAQTTTTTGSAPAAAASSHTVTLAEKEFSITPNSISLARTGTYRFKITNNGQIGHALEIEGHGVEQRTSTIEPGKTATLQVDLAKAGSYEVYCPIDDHKNRGMKASLTVGGSAAVGGTSTEGTTTGQTSTTKGGYGY